mmetsp:Transcript_31342/g.70534  ORF Transcript_31342/g.70534 Transcript_31342/m.70534 type:complete len:246 (-) Transcript_31342:499-1236(-)
MLLASCSSLARSSFQPSCRIISFQRFACSRPCFLHRSELSSTRFLRRTSRRIENVDPQTPSVEMKEDRSSIPARPQIAQRRKKPVQNVCSRSESKRRRERLHTTTRLKSFGTKSELSRYIRVKTPTPMKKGHVCRASLPSSSLPLRPSISGRKAVKNLNMLRTNTTRVHWRGGRRSNTSTALLLVVVLYFLLPLSFHGGDDDASARSQSRLQPDAPTIVLLPSSSSPYTTNRTGSSSPSPSAVTR